MASNASHSSSTSLSTSFTHLKRRDVDFFDQVIARLPQHSSAFADLKAAYNHARTKDARGRALDPNADAALWDTLLRLTHVRGKSWAQRWDAVRLTLGLEPRLVSEDEESHNSASDRDQTPRPAHASERESTREASLYQYARSVNDSTAQTIESPTADVRRRRAGHGSRQRPTGGGVDPARMEALRAKVASLSVEAASLVSELGHNEADEKGKGSQKPVLTAGVRFNSGERTGKDRQLRFALTHDELDTSKATTVESASDEDEGHARTLARQSRRSHSSHHAASASPASPRPSKRRFEELVARSRSERDAARQAEEAQKDLAEEARLEPAYRLADEFYGDTLKRKCLSWWKSLHNTATRRMADTVQTRDHMVQQKTLIAWRIKQLEAHRSMLNAAKVDLVRCKLSAWRVWLRRLEAVRKKRLHDRRMQLRGGFEVTRSRFEHRLVADYFQRWKLTLLENRASRFRSEHLLRGSISLWRINAWQSAEVRDKERQLTHTRSVKLKRIAWARWKGAVQLHDSLAIADSYLGQRLMQTTLDRWRDAVQQSKMMRQREALADRWHKRRVKQTAFQSWSQRAADMSEMQRKANGFATEHLKRSVASHFHLWVLREREELFTRVSSRKIMGSALRKWHGKQVEMAAALERTASFVDHMVSLGNLRRSFALWNDATHQIVAAQRLAAKRDHRSVLLQSLQRWKDALQCRDVTSLQARALDTVNVQRRFFKAWIECLRRRKLESWQQKSDGALMRNTLTIWRLKAIEKQHEVQAVRQVQRRVDHRLAEQSLKLWMERVIDRKSNMMEAAERHDAILSQRAWQTWLRACIRHDDLFNLSNSFADVKREEWTRRLFTNWLNTARSERSRRERAERFVVERQRLLANRALDRWYDRYAESTLHDQELECLLHRQEAVKRAKLLRWKNKTFSLPAVRLDHARLKSHAFFKWKGMLPYARRERQAERQDRKVMQAKAFDHWLRLAKAKRAFRAAARFGGPSAIRMRAAHRRLSGGTGGGGAIGGQGSGGGVFSVGARSGRAARRRGRGSLPAAEEAANAQGSNAIDTLLRTELSSLHSRAALDIEDQTDRQGHGRIDADVSSLRESDLNIRGSPAKYAEARSQQQRHGEQQLSLAQLLLDDPSDEPTTPTGRSTLPAIQRSASSASGHLLRWRQGVQRQPVESVQSNESSSLSALRRAKPGDDRLSSEISSEPGHLGSHANVSRRHAGRETVDNEGVLMDRRHSDDRRMARPSSRAQSEATLRLPDRSGL